MMKILILIGLFLLSDVLLAKDSNSPDYETAHFNNKDPLSVLFICLHIGQKFMIIDDAKALTKDVVKKLKYDDPHIKSLLSDSDKYWRDFEKKRGENVGSIYWDSNCKHQTRRLRESFQ